MNIWAREGPKNNIDWPVKKGACWLSKTCAECSRREPRMIDTETHCKMSSETRQELSSWSPR
eukprot:4434025-Karenia_brevis.AAC.1